MQACLYTFGCYLPSFLPPLHSITKDIFWSFTPWNEHGRLQPLIAFHRPRNLRDYSGVQAVFTSTPRELPGSYLCGAPRCKTCLILMTSNKFSSHTTGKSFKIKIRTSCKSSNVIYLITCTMCCQNYGRWNRPTVPLEGQWSPIWHWAQEDWRVSCVITLQQRSAHSSRSVSRCNSTCS